MNNKQFTPVYDTDYIQKWYFDKKFPGVAGSIIEHKVDTNGSHIKYSDGTLICYKMIIKSTSIDTQWGNWYIGTIDLGDWSYEFIERPQVQVSNVGTNGALIQGFSVRPTKTKAGTLNVVRPDAYITQIYINVMAIGRWK